MEVQSLHSSLNSSGSEEIRILFVDDSEELRIILREVLASEGFIVDVASGPKEALEIIQTKRPDAILCDIMMPGDDGYSFQKRLKEDSNWCHIPFIFLSALSTPEDIRSGKSAGCDDYLTKPFDTEELVSVISGKVLQARARQRHSSEEFSQYRKRVVHTLSHEFRTPLVAINTGAELLLDRSNETDEDTFVRLLESVHRGGLRLQRLVEDFMSLQQIETGSALKVAERLKRRIKAQQLAREALEHYHDQTHDRSLLVEFRDETAGAAYVEVYDAQIHNIVSRLLSNAHKFGGTAIPAVLTVKTSQDVVSIAVRDHGPGLPEGVVNRACELFSQIDRDRLEQQGCGLGLTIANQYAAYNSGKLLFLAPLFGRGLEVELRLPRVK